MIERLRRWFGMIPTTETHGSEDGNRPAGPPKATSKWVLRVRTPMGPRPTVEGDVYEWCLTLIAPRDDRVCRIDGISFFVRCDTTIAASRTIERMRRTQGLTRSELSALIDEHRAAGSPVYLQRSIDAVERTEQFKSGADAALHEVLEWGGIGSEATPETNDPE